MTGNPNPPKTRSGGERFELRLEPGSESVIHLVAVAPTELHLSLVKEQTRHSGRSTFITLKGSQTNLPRDTVCNIVVKTFSCGMEGREYTVPNVPLRINGKDCSLEAEVDIFEASFFGKGKAELTVIPDFPFAGECKVPEPFEFDNPLGIQGLDIGKDKEPVLIGKAFELASVMSRRFKDLKSTLRLSVFNSVELKKGEKPRMAPEASRYATLEWSHDEAGRTKHWRAGCAVSEGHVRLAYFESFKASYGFDLRVEVLQEIQGEEKTYLLWEKPQAFSYPRPKLTGFAFKDRELTVKVENLDTDFALKLELSLWRYQARAVGDAYSSAWMDPISKPELVRVNAPEYFFRLLWEEQEELTNKIFALLRIPRSLTGTEDYVPIHAVMDYDETKFLPFDDDELWLEPPKTQGQPKQKQQKTPRELATAVASQELPSRASRAPHFGEVWTGVRDNNLLVGIKLVGEVLYWRDAAPIFSLCDPSGETELLRLDAKPSQDNPRLYEALIPLDNPNLRNQKVCIRGQVTRSDARLWGELVVKPPEFTVPYEGVPKLSDLKATIVELTDDTPYLEVRCRATHVPNGKEGCPLELRFYEFFSDATDPILLPGVPFRYDIAKGAGGQCDARGRLVARLREEELVKRIKNQGKFRIEVRVLPSDKANQSIALPVIHKDIGSTPRKLEGTMVWGGHEAVSAEFRKKVLVICERLKIKPDHLMACMALETAGTFSPSIQNSGGSHAYGLIQFTAGALEDINKTRPQKITMDQLRALSGVEQLDYVQAYFAPLVTTTPFQDLGDVYMAILCKRGIGQPPDYVCYKQGEPGYKGNASLDKGPNGKPKGYFTKGDATARAQEWLDRGQKSRL